MSNSDDSTAGGLLTKAQVATINVLRGGAIKLRERLVGAFTGEGEPTPAAKGTLADVAITAAKAGKMAAEIGKAAMEPHLIHVENIKGLLKPLVEQFRQIEKEAKEAAARVIEAEAEARRRAEARARAEQEEAKARQEAAQKAARAALAAGDADAARTHEIEAAEAYTDGRDAKAAIPHGPVPNMVTGTSGGLFGRQDWGWDVEDLSKVPDEFTLRVVSEDAVQAAINRGVREIPGLHLYQRTTMVSKPARAAKTKR